MLASTGVAAGTGLLFWVVAAHRVRPDVLGIAAGLVAANAFLSYLTGFALPYAMLRFGGQERGTSRRLNASLAFSALTSAVAAVGFALLARFVSPELAPSLRSTVDTALFALAGVGAAAAVLLDNLLAARRRAGVVLARNVAAGVLKLLPLAWLPAGDPRGLYLAVTLPALATAGAVLLALPRLLPGYRLAVGWGWSGDPYLREVRDFAARNVAGSLLSGAPQFALPLIAVSVLGARQNAFFYVAWSIAQIVYLVPSVIANISLSQGSPGSAADLDARSRRFSLLLLAPACGVGVLAPGVVLWLYGGAYAAAAAWPLRLLLLGAVPWTVVILAQSRLRTEHRFGALTVLTGGFCVASLSVPVAAGAAWGGTGMAGGWLAAVAAAAALAWSLARAR